MLKLPISGNAEYRTNAKMNYLTCLSPRLLLEILSFFSPQDLWKVGAVSKALTNFAEDSEEMTWKVACSKRWNLQDITLEKLAAHRFKEVYRSFFLKRLLPYGKYSSFQTSFGYGKISKLCGWLLLEHRSSGLLKRNSENVSDAELRICIQNLSCFSRLLRLSNGGFVIDLVSCEEVEDGVLSCHYVKLLSKNGIISNSNKDEILLLPYEFAVLGVGVKCPKSVENEPDLLAAIEKIQINISDNVQEPPLTIYRDDEDKIWASYQALPRGHFLLKNSPS